MCIDHLERSHPEYKHLVVVRVVDFHYEPGPGKMTLCCSKGVVTRSIKGDWRPKEVISFYHLLDEPFAVASTRPSDEDEYELLLFLNEHGTNRIHLDAGEWESYDPVVIDAVFKPGSAAWKAWQEARRTYGQ